MTNKLNETRSTRRVLNNEELEQVNGGFLPIVVSFIVAELGVVAKCLAKRADKKRIAKKRKARKKSSVKGSITASPLLDTAIDDGFDVECA